MRTHNLNFIHSNQLQKAEKRGRIENLQMVKQKQIKIINLKKIINSWLYQKI